MTGADLDAACLDVGRLMVQAAIGRDRDLALRAVVEARRLRGISPEIGLVVRLPYDRCQTCGRGGRR